MMQGTLDRVKEGSKGTEKNAREHGTESSKVAREQ